MAAVGAPGPAAARRPRRHRQWERSPARKGEVRMGSARFDERYRRLREHYHSGTTAAGYDARLFRRDRFADKNERQLAALGRLLDHAEAVGRPIRRILDLPCGTGRLLPALALPG